jgi:hypothetical protein
MSAFWEMAVCAAPAKHGLRQYLTVAILGVLEELVGAVVAVEGVKKSDPDASALREGIAAVTGFEGVQAVTEHLEKKDDGSETYPS